MSVQIANKSLHNGDTIQGIQTSNIILPSGASIQDNVEIQMVLHKLPGVIIKLTPSLSLEVGLFPINCVNS